MQTYFEERMIFFVSLFMGRSPKTFFGLLLRYRETKLRVIFASIKGTASVFILGVPNANMLLYKCSWLSRCSAAGGPDH